jgi:multidrug efflux pump subunit AcrB
MNEFLSALYSKPWRVYILVFLLSMAGVAAGLHLPISLYPNTNRPSLNVSLSYGNLNALEFRKVYGQSIEASLRNFNQDNLSVDSIDSEYGQSSVTHRVQFGWG